MLLNHEQAAIGTRYRTLHHQQIALRISLNYLQFLRRYARIPHLTSHTRSLEDAARRRARTNRTGSAQAIRLTVRLGSAAKAVPLDATLETLTFGGPNDVNRLAIPEQAGIKLCAQLYLLGCGAVLQFDFAQYFEWTKLWSRTALAVFLHLEQLLNLLVRLLGGRRIIGKNILAFRLALLLL